MSSLVPWKLLLFLCATSFGEQLAKAAPMENPRTLGLRMAWERGPRGWSGGGGEGALSPREARLCPAAAARCAPRGGGGGGGGGGRPSPAPRGAVLVQREKDLAAAAYNWNSFGLRYGKRLAAAAAPGAGGPGGRGGREPAGLGAGTPPPPPPPPLLGRRRRRDGQ